MGIRSEFTADLERMNQALENLKDALTIHSPKSSVYDGGNFLVVDFPNLYDACEFARPFDTENGGKFVIRINQGCSQHFAFATSITFEYK